MQSLCIECQGQVHTSDIEMRKAECKQIEKLKFLRFSCNLYNLKLDGNDGYIHKSHQQQY